MSLVVISCNKCRIAIVFCSDANKKLHDTNDDLRAALENSKSAHKRPHSLVGTSRLPPTSY